MEDIKSEPSSDNTSKKELEEDNSSSGRNELSSPDLNCPICLGQPNNKAFTNSCMHQFCFSCLLEWSKVKAECPLCKQRFSSIYHSVRTVHDFEQYFLPPPEMPRQFGCRSHLFQGMTFALSYYQHMESAELDISEVLIPPPTLTIPSSFTIPSFPRPLPCIRRRSHGNIDFRRHIYHSNLWVRRMQDVTGRYRESSPEFYRRNPAQVNRLIPWLNRELSVLICENQRQDLMDLVIQLIHNEPIRSSNFRTAITPFLRLTTPHFIHEFYSYATSPYDILGYDRHCIYASHSSLSLAGERILTSSEESGDSDIQFVSETVNPAPPVEVVEVVDNVVAEEVLITESESDDCIVLDTTRPSLQEIPELIILEDSSEDSKSKINNSDVKIKKEFSSLGDGLDNPQPGPSSACRMNAKPQKRHLSRHSNSSTDSGTSVESIESERNKRKSKKKVTHKCSRIIKSSSSENSSNESDNKNYLKKRKGKSERRRKVSKRKVSKRRSKPVKRKRKISYTTDSSDNSSSSSAFEVHKSKKTVAVNTSPKYNHPTCNINLNIDHSNTGGRPRLKSVAVKIEASQRNTGHSNLTYEEVVRHNQSQSKYEKIKAENQMANVRVNKTDSSSSSRHLSDRLVDLNLYAYKDSNDISCKKTRSNNSLKENEDGQCSSYSTPQLHKKKQNDIIKKDTYSNNLE